MPFPGDFSCTDGDTTCVTSSSIGIDWHVPCSIIPIIQDNDNTSVRTMGHRETTLLWLRDSLEHLTNTQQQLEWSEEREAVRLLTETMLRDLERCRRLVESLHHKALQVA